MGQDTRRCLLLLEEFIMASYEKPEPYEWIQPIRKGYKLCCCDCGLVHKFEFRVSKGQIQFRGDRDNRATAMVRRHMKRREHGAKDRADKDSA